MPFMFLYCFALGQYTVINQYLSSHFSEEDFAANDSFDSFMDCWSIALINYDDDYKTPLGKLMYFFLSLLFNIIMLNLLISIVGNSYSEFNDIRDPQDYKAKSALLLSLAQIRNLTDQNLGCIFSSAMVFLITPFIVALSLASVILQFFIINPIQIICESCGCRKKKNNEFKSRFITHEGGEAGDVKEVQQYKYLHIIRKLKSKNDGESWNREVETSISDMKEELQNISDFNDTLHEETR
jgi:hypothetical protein